MNNFIDMSLEMSPDVLRKGGAPQTLYCLIRIKPEQNKNLNQGKIPLDLRMVLDNSGSMERFSGANSKKTAMSLLKDACKRAVDMLEPLDRLTIYTFSNSSKSVLKPTIITGKNENNAAKKAIDKIRTEGSTHLSTSLEDVMHIQNMDQYIQRVMLFTDGEVNVPSEKTESKKCLISADKAKKLKLPFWVYGTGISYNEKFLKNLAARSGGHFEHVAEPGDVVRVFGEQMNYFQNVSVTNVEITLESIPGAIFRKISRVIPDIESYNNLGQDYFSANIPDIDRVRGAAILLQLEVSPVFFSRSPLADITLTYDVPVFGLKGVTQQKRIEIDFTDDDSLLKPNRNVMDIVTLQGAHDLTTLAASKAETGQGALATKMMQQAAVLYQKIGQNDVASDLVTLSNAIQQQGTIQGQNLNTQRTLTTVSSQLVTKRLTNSQL
jgi:Mg-chelatase subunit ChlD